MIRNLFRSKKRLPDNWKPVAGTVVKGTLAYAFTDIVSDKEQADFYLNSETKDAVIVRRKTNV